MFIDCIIILKSCCITAIRPEEYSAPCLRCPQRSHGHEHHFQGEERNTVDRPANKFRTGMPKFRGMIAV